MLCDPEKDEKPNSVNADGTLPESEADVEIQGEPTNEAEHSARPFRGTPGAGDHLPFFCSTTFVFDSATTAALPWREVILLVGRTITKAPL